MKTDLFQSCGHCQIVQICWYIECSTFTASSFRIWNSSTGIPSPPLAFFIAMLPKAHLTSHSSMSGSRWGITPSWLSGSWISFLYSSSVYSGHLFLISSASLRSLPFLSFISLSKISFQYVISVKTVNGIIYLLFHITSLTFGTSQFELATSQVLSCHMWLVATILSCVVLDGNCGRAACLPRRAY